MHDFEIAQRILQITQIDKSRTTRLQVTAGNKSNDTFSHRHSARV